MVGFTPSRQGQAASRSPMANLDRFALSKAGVEPDIPHNSIDHSLRGKPQKMLGELLHHRYFQVCRSSL
ncbi:hypothetical protein R4I92_003677 [Acinetobacter baumannii]|nr:hypothetical protein [Acinetobacter baumannii]